MPDSYDQNSVDTGLSLDLIEEEIEAGLPMHADRLVRCFVNEEYYAGRNAAFLRPKQAEDWVDFLRRPKRTSKLTRQVVRKLTQHLYAPGPQRKLSGGGDALLQQIYTQNNVNAVMGQADRKAVLNGACLVGAEATGDPEKPIRLYVWGAHEFVAFSRPDDPTEAWAVVTIGRERKLLDGRMKERLRFTAWSRDEHRVYTTEWRDMPPSNIEDWARLSYSSLFGQTAAYQRELSGWSEDGVHNQGHNPYGCLPFVVVSDETRVSTLYEGGIGDALVECNAEIDRELTDLAAHTAEFMDPDRFTRNVASTFRREKNRSRWQPLPPMPGAKTGDTNLEPDAFLVQGELAVQDIWLNLRNYADNTIEELDLPLASVRMDASTDLSGIAIVAKQLPLLQRTKQRQQEPFTGHEQDLARMVLTVHGNFYRDSAALAASDAELTLIWPEPSFPLPTPERDAEDQADLEAGRKSLVQIVAERMGCTPDQAWEQVERVLQDNSRYEALLKQYGMVQPDPLPEPGQPGGGNQTSPGDGDGPAAENPTEDTQEP